MTAGLATPTLEDRLDRLAGQVDELIEEMHRQRQMRERMAELTHDLTPIAGQAMAGITRELESLQDVVTTEDLVRFARALARALPALESLVGQTGPLTELAGDAAGLGKPAMAMLTARLSELEERGYFAFARQGLGVVDRIVTTYGEDDIRALADNVVLILDTVKEMTQPEVMGLLRRTMNVVQEEEPAEPPSFFALLREMRDPSVRRGLGRMLTMLRSVGTEGPAGADTATTRR